MKETKRALCNLLGRIQGIAYYGEKGGSCSIYSVEELLQRFNALSKIYSMMVWLIDSKESMGINLGAVWTIASSGSLNLSVASSQIKNLVGVS